MVATLCSPYRVRSVFHVVVDWLIFLAVRYEDDELFAAALELLEGTFTQRRNLIDALGDVILLPTNELPVFCSVAVASADLSFLTFLVRSYSVWGVCSRVSGPFDGAKRDLALDTLARLIRFFATPPIKTAPSPAPSPSLGPQSALGRRLAAKRPEGQVGIDFTSMFDALSEGPSEGVALTATARTPGNPLLSGDGASSSECVASVDGADDSGSSGVLPSSTLHQDVCRCLGLQTSLLEGLGMDYNLAFRGSICTSEEKVCLDTCSLVALAGHACTPLFRTDFLLYITVVCV